MTNDDQTITTILPADSSGLDGNSSSSSDTPRITNLHTGKKIEETSPEEKELKAQFELFNRFPKLKKWAILFTDKNNKATYGNRTESAMQAYNCKDRISAGVIGSQNFKKLNGLVTVFADDKGMTLEKLLDTAMARAVHSDNSKWWELVTEFLGYRDPKGAQVVVNNNTQTNIQVNGEDAKDFSKAFTQFLEEER